MVKEKKRYYKYMSLEKVDRFLDVLINKRLYAASYKELNDPFEGHFDKNGLNGLIIRDVYTQLYSTRICALQMVGKYDPNQRLMWSHYTNGQTGCCLKVSIRGNVNLWTEKTINYSGYLPKVYPSNIPLSVEVILSHKTCEWSYENEVRFIRKSNKYKDKCFLPVKVEAVYFGLAMKSEKKKMLATLVKKLDPSIEIYEMREDPNASFYSDLVAHRI